MIDIFSFGMLCLWLLFETYFSRIMLPPQGLDLAADAFSSSTESAKDILSKIKAELQTCARQLLAAETAMDNDTRMALEEFFDSSLSKDPKKREMSLQNFMCKLGPQR
jgi:hypothetical protein